MCKSVFMTKGTPERKCIVCSGKLVEDTQTIRHTMRVPRPWWSLSLSTTTITREEEQVTGYHCETCGLMYKFEGKYE